MAADNDGGYANVSFVTAAVKAYDKHNKLIDSSPVEKFTASVSVERQSNHWYVFYYHEPAIT